ncbi:MAG TPA: PQQ-binding-like beta-propeller repeat protein [Candidatus Binatia bacterium]
MRTVDARFLLVLAAALVVACSDAQRASVDPAIPPEVREHADDWPLPGRDYANTRATTDSTIDASNVATLVPAWQTPLPGRGAYGNVATTPLIVGDTIYLEDLSSNIHAIDRETGAVRWRTEYDRFVIGPNGVALGWGKIFGVIGTEAIVALDATNGAEIWRRSLTRTATDGIDIQPTVYADLVFASSVPISLQGVYTGGDQGVLHALRQDTGDVVWTFDTIEPGFWGNPEVNSGGGAWYPPAIDTERKRIYWAVANPAPFPGTAEFPNGSSRPGPNLYTNTLVTLDLRDGALDWYQQAIPHDLFDHDLIHSLLVDVREGGRTRRIVVATGKGGKVIGHDIDTGATLWTTPVGIHQNDDLTALEGPTEVLPGTFGGVLTPPSTADGIVYVATLNAPSILEPDVPEILGGNVGTMDGQVVAIDARDGRIVWDVFVPGDPLGGTTVVNDLVWTATLQGQIIALDRATGATVWIYDAPGGINSSPAVADDVIVWPVGLSNPAVLLALRLPR